MAEPKPEKPYKLDTVSKPWSETDVETWWLTLMDFIKSVPKFKKSMQSDKTWGPKNVDKRGLEGSDAQDRADVIDSILLKIAKNGPSAIFQDIVYRSTSYDYIRNAIRKVCGFPNASNKLVSYFALKNSFDISQEEFNTHYYNMRDVRIGCLLKKNSSITFNGKKLNADEELTPALECQIVADWLESIGGVKLLKFVFQEYSRDLETCTLYDMQETLGQKETMNAILEKMNVEEEGKMNRIDYKKNDKGRNAYQRRHCYICEEEGRKFDSHDTKYCWRKNESKRKTKNYKAKLRTTTRVEEYDSDSSDTEEDIRNLITKIKIKSKRYKAESSSEEAE